jgi:hypothetical protein
MCSQEHEILVNYKPNETPEPVDPATAMTEEPIQHNSNLEDTGVLGEELEPGTAQPYDESGNPMVRNPDGVLVDSTGDAVRPTTARFTAEGSFDFYCCVIFMSCS